MTYDIHRINVVLCGNGMDYEEESFIERLYDPQEALSVVEYLRQGAHPLVSYRISINEE